MTSIFFLWLPFKGPGVSTGLRGLVCFDCASPRRFLVIADDYIGRFMFFSFFFCSSCFEAHLMSWEFIDDLQQKFPGEKKEERRGLGNREGLNTFTSRERKKRDKKTTALRPGRMHLRTELNRADCLLLLSTFNRLSYLLVVIFGGGVQRHVESGDR